MFLKKQKIIFNINISKQFKKHTKKLIRSKTNSFLKKKSVETLSQIDSK